MGGGRHQHGAVPPEYACAIISDDRGRLLLQLRPAGARHAPDQLTCFGGRREGDEDDAACLRRELAEELAWAPPAISPACELWDGTRFIARFFRAAWDGQPFTVEAGHVALWAPVAALPGLPVSPWHRRVLDALSAGGSRVDLGGAGSGRDTGDGTGS